MKVVIPQWWAVALPTIAIMVVDFARHEILTGWMHPWWEEGALLAGVLVVTLATSQLLSSRVERSKRREREAESLRRVAMEITSSLELNAVLSSVLSHGREILDIDCLGIAMAEAPRRELMMQTRGSSTPRKTLNCAGARCLWDAMATGESQEVTRSTPASAEGSCMFCRHCIAIPMRVGSQLLGALCVGSSKTMPPSAADRQLAQQLADLASVAIANALLHERSRALAALEERDRLAREMHDSIAQVLGYISMKLAAGRELLARGESRQLDTELAEMGQVVDDAYLDVREAILGLRVSAGSPGGLAGALDEYLQKFSRQFGLATRLQVQQGESFGLPPQAEIQLLRVVQEALTNVRKHAGAANVQVRLQRDEGEIRLCIQDDGRGIGKVPDTRPLGGYGITSMRERLEGIGGSLSIDSAEGKGTVVMATAPLSNSGGSDGAEG